MHIAKLLPLVLLLSLFVQQTESFIQFLFIGVMIVAQLTTLIISTVQMVESERNQQRMRQIQEKNQNLAELAHDLSVATERKAAEDADADQQRENGQPRNVWVGLTQLRIAKKIMLTVFDALEKVQVYANELAQGESPSQTFTDEQFEEIKRAMNLFKPEVATLNRAHANINAQIAKFKTFGIQVQTAQILYDHTLDLLAAAKIFATKFNNEFPRRGDLEGLDSVLQSIEVQERQLDRHFPVIKNRDLHTLVFTWSNRFLRISQDESVYAHEDVRNAGGNFRPVKCLNGAIVPDYEGVLHYGDIVGLGSACSDGKTRYVGNLDGKPQHLRGMHHCQAWEQWKLVHPYREDDIVRPLRLADSVVLRSQRDTSMSCYLNNDRHDETDTNTCIVDAGCHMAFHSKAGWFDIGNQLN